MPHGSVLVQWLPYLTATEEQPDISMTNEIMTLAIGIDLRIVPSGEDGADIFPASTHNLVGSNDHKHCSDPCHQLEMVSFTGFLDFSTIFVL